MSLFFGENSTHQFCADVRCVVLSVLPFYVVLLLNLHVQRDFSLSGHTSRAVFCALSRNSAIRRRSSNLRITETGKLTHF